MGEEGARSHGDFERRIVAGRLQFSFFLLGCQSFDETIREMEEDHDIHHTIVRYCSDVLGVLRRDEKKRRRRQQQSTNPVIFGGGMAAIGSSSGY